MSEGGLGALLGGDDTCSVGEQLEKRGRQRSSVSIGKWRRLGWGGDR